MAFLKIGKLQIRKKEFFIFLFVLFILAMFIGAAVASTTFPKFILYIPVIMLLYFVYHKGLLQKNSTGI